MAFIDSDVSNVKELNMDLESAISTNVIPCNKMGKSTYTALPKTGITIGAKRRKNRSEVWDYFEKLKEGTCIEPDNGVYKKASCRICKTVMICDSRHGTTNLRRHIKACVELNGKNDAKQMFDDVPLRNSEGDHSVYRKLLMKMIVRHGLPFSLVQYEGVRDVHNFLNSDVKHITRNTCQADMFKLHRKGKSKAIELLSSCPGRVSLSCNFWSSVTDDSYMCIRAHFIDKDWKIQSLLLCFSLCPPPCNDSLVSEKLSKLLAEGGWNIEHKLMAITLDSVTNDFTLIDSYTTKLLSQGALPLRGRFLRVRCVAQVINSIVEVGLDELHGVIQKVRDSVKYVKGSPFRLMQFNEVVREKKIPCDRKLKHDVKTRWNSTYLMLESALYYKCAFSHLAIVDKSYPYCLSSEEWKKVEAFCKFFKHYYDLTNILLSSECPTSNLFFHSVWAIQYQFLEEAKNPDPFISALVMRMQRKFDNYWEECNLILSVGVVLDPRYKMRAVEYAYTKIYGKVEGSLKARLVHDVLVILFDEYKNKSSLDLRLSQSSQVHQEGFKTLIDDVYSNDFETFMMDRGIVEEKSELDWYLKEPLMDRKQDLDIVEWWKSFQYGLPRLSKLARDMLSIPIISVTSKSAFNVGERNLKPDRCSLSHECIEALICTRNWIFGLEEEDQGHVDASVEAMLSLDLNVHTSQGAAKEELDID